MNKKGLALLEVLIGIAVFAIVVIGFLQGVNLGILGTSRVDVSNLELNLARSQMEYIESQAYIIYDDECNPVEGQPYMTIEEIHPPFNVTTAVSNVPGIDAEALQLVTVTVTYPGGSELVELDGYKINPAVLPALYDLPLIETIDIPVPILPGGDSRTLGSGEFFVFYGYPFTFYIPREGAVAVTWIVDQAETYGSTNRMDVYLYQHAEDDAPFDDEFYDNRWDTTCYNCSVPADCYHDCTQAVNWGPLVPDFPRIVLMDDPNCRLESNLDLRTQCHDEELPHKREGSECGEPGSVCIAHDEVTYLGEDGYILTTVLTSDEGTLSGTVTFTLGSTIITGSGTAFSAELEAGNLIRKSNGAEWYTVASIESDSALTLTTVSQDDGADTTNATLYRDETIPAGWYTVFFYNSNPVDPQSYMNYLYTVATDLASVSFYSEAP